MTWKPFLTIGDLIPPMQSLTQSQIMVSPQTYSMQNVLQLDWPSEMDTKIKKIANKRRGRDHKWKALFKAHPLVQGFKLNIYFWQDSVDQWMVNTYTSLVHRTSGCALSKTLVPRSQALLRCLGLLANYFFSKPSCCISAQKLCRLMSIRILSTSKN